MIILGHFHHKIENKTMSSTTFEAAMLDDIEASSKRVYAQSRALKSEADYQHGITTGLSGSMAHTSQDLQDEANYVARIDKESNEGICFLYGVITLETLMIFFLLITF